jgi:hypothetical protein
MYLLVWEIPCKLGLYLTDQRCVNMTINISKISKFTDGITVFGGLSLCWKGTNFVSPEGIFSTKETISYDAGSKLD